MLSSQANLTVRFRGRGAMGGYRRVEKRPPSSSIGENEVRITSKGMIGGYVSYAFSLFEDKGAEEIVLNAMGQAINKAVIVSEIIKKRIPTLYQHIDISSISVTDTWEPIEEGLDSMEMIRYVSMISIILSFNELNKNSPGYQAPLLIEQTKQQPRQQLQQRQLRQAQGNVFGGSYGQGHGQGRERGQGMMQQAEYNDDHGIEGYNNYQGYQRGKNMSYQQGAGMGYKRETDMNYVGGRGGGSVYGRGIGLGRRNIGGHGRGNRV